MIPPGYLIVVCDGRFQTLIGILQTKTKETVESLTHELKSEAWNIVREYLKIKAKP